MTHKNRIGYTLPDMHGNELGVTPNRSLNNLETDSLVYDEEYDAELASIFSGSIEKASYDRRGRNVTCDLRGE